MLTYYIVGSKMGMFDSFFIEMNGRSIELQTKRFEQLLYRYQLGSVIRGVPSGISVYFDTVRLDQANNQIFTPNDVAKIYTVFVVLSHSVFVDYESVEGELTPEDIKSKVGKLKDKWSDTTRLIYFLVEALAEKENTLNRLQDRIFKGLNLIDEILKSRAGRTFTTSWLPNRNLARVEQGEDPLEVIRSVLTSDENETFPERGKMQQDLDILSNYRL